jgi:DNA (cytosine-5)-methyltransferase 1
VAPYLTEHANASNQRVFSVNEPLRTQVAQVKGGHFALVSAFFEQANGGWYDGDGRSLHEPLSTICTSGANQRLITAYFVKYYGNEREGVSLREPMHTVTTKDRMGLVRCVQIPADALSPEQRRKAKRCADFLHEYLPEHFPTACDAVLVGNLVLVDFTLRMLAPRELARAQGFPDSYEIATGLFETLRGSGIYVRKPISKTDQVRGIGNSVCPPVARALVAANLGELIDLYARAAA